MPNFEILEGTIVSFDSDTKGWFTRAIFFGNIAEQCNFEARILSSPTISWDRKIPIEIALLRNFTMILSR